MSKKSSSKKQKFIQESQDPDNSFFDDVSEDVIEIIEDDEEIREILYQYSQIGSIPKIFYTQIKRYLETTKKLDKIIMSFNGIVDSKNEKIAKISKDSNALIDSPHLRRYFDKLIGTGESKFDDDEDENYVDDQTRLERVVGPRRQSD